MADTFVDEIVNNGTPVRGGGGRAPIELVEGDRGRATAVQAPPPDDQVDGGTRSLPSSIKEKFEAMRAARAAARAAEPPAEEDPDAPPGETPAEAAAAGADPAKAAPVAAGAKPADPPAATLPPNVADDLARYERSNRELVAKVEALEQKSKASDDVHPVLAASTAFLEDSMGSVRKFIAHSLGVSDPNAPEVDIELEAIKIDLTSKDLGVTPDPAYQAKRDAARAKQLWARERSERKATEQSATERSAREADARKEADAAATVQTKLSATTDYPLLTSLAQIMDGMPAGHLVRKVIEREKQTGRLDPKTHSDDQMIATAARLVEDYYKSQLPRLQTLLAQATGAPPNPNPSTATPSGKSPPAANPSASPASQPSPARTLTTADASVAPATPPATKPAPADKKPKQFKNDDERKKWALRHLRQRRA